MARFIYGSGDNGSTINLSGKRVSKSDLSIEAVGDLDELNSHIGLCRAYCKDNKVNSMLLKVQKELFKMGSEVSLAGDKASQNIPTLEESDLKELEEFIKDLSKDLPEIKRFVLPSGSKCSLQLNIARAVSRRAERSIVKLAEFKTLNPYILKYANRISTFLFVASLYANKIEGIEDTFV
ncbi:MAG: cob(I)yrinic acid a,c-diamide adenosyltransferase [Candidatus Micrarchaeia archaeon]